MNRMLDIFSKWDGLIQSLFLILVLCLVGGFLYRIFDRIMDLIDKIIEARKQSIVRPPTRMDGEKTLEALKEINKEVEGIVRRKARLAGYDGCLCPICGARKLIPSGTTFKCDGCNITLTVQPS